MKIVFYRGFLAAQLVNNSEDRKAIASVAMPEDAIEPYLEEVAARSDGRRLTIACVNSPANVTVAGDLSCVDTLVDLIGKQGVFARKLQVNVAYHSAHMAEILDQYADLIKDVSPAQIVRNQPVVFSSVTGALLPADRLSHCQYWLTNLTSKVCFSDALTEMSSYLLRQKATTSSGKDLLIEIGPTSALQRPIKDIISLTPINSPTSTESELRLLVDLPPHSFNHQQTYWTESRISKNFRTRKHARHELLGTPSADWNTAEPKWRNVIRLTENPWILHHRVRSSY